MSRSARKDLQDAARRRLGQVLDGKYRLEDVLGVGASGSVFRAANTLSGRAVALKVFHGHAAEEAQARRFVREAMASNRVLRNGQHHPNVIESYDVGRDPTSGELYLVQELLEGETLTQHVEIEPLRRVDVGRAMALLGPVLDAMACAHALGIVHRDLKPDNIFLDRRGGAVVPKVLDFGVAQLADARVTPTHELLGTPLYMPPEAFTSASVVDARGDVWALGVILYELLSGATPFEGEDSAPRAVLQRITSEAIPSLAGVGGVTPAVWNVLRRALERDPDRRYANAEELQAALQGAVAPACSLRIPPGMDAQTLREGLLRGAKWVRDAVRLQGSRPGDEAAAQAEPEGLAGRWWALVFQRSGHDADGILDVVTLPELANLVELQVSGVALGNQGVGLLVQCPRLATVASLSLRGVGLGPSGAAALARAPALAGLQRLDLEDNRVGAAGVRELSVTGALASLQWLSLADNALDASAGAALASSGLPRRLLRLDLGRNNLGDEGLRALGQVAAWHPEAWLVLARNNASRHAVDAAAAALRPKVRKLVL
ncbi:MAG: serine/threonine protein kinase [Deltaproteobacteria bacterium]|nr:serine/threonine protein kinase [Deltaproteobacteria bacterium]